MTDDPRPGFNALRDKMRQHLEVHRTAKLEDLAQAAATFAYEALYLPGSPDVPHVQRTAPRRIYLCVSDDLDDRDEPFTEEVTWAADEAVNVTVPYVRADLAALAAPKAEAWQPIETAPKDGSMFLCWVQAERWSHPDGGGSGIAHDVSQIDFCWWRAFPEAPNGGYFDAACGQIGDGQDVTHWMPLPAPPASPAPQEAPHAD